MAQLLFAFLEIVRLTFILIGFAAGTAILSAMVAFVAWICMKYAKTFHVEHKNAIE
jgi:phage shock protein PspC (stress-responsive transcriptional regulator)